MAGCHLVLSGENTTDIKRSDDCAVHLCTMVSSQASLLRRGLGFLAAFALWSCLVCSILRVLSLQLGASVVTKDDSLPVSTIAVVFLLPVETPLVQPTHVALQPFRTRHGMFDDCHQHVVLLSLVRLPGSQLSYASLLYIKLTTLTVLKEHIHEATACQS